MAVTLLEFDQACWHGDTVPVTAGDLPAYPADWNGRKVIVFPDGSDEHAAVTLAVAMPQAFAGGALSFVLGILTSATTGTFDVDIYVEAVTPGDAINLNTTTSFDSANASITTVPGSTYVLMEITVSLSNTDGVAVGDMLRFLARRDSDDGANDTASAEMGLLWAELREG